jgi:hypothetical protein
MRAERPSLLLFLLRSQHPLKPRLRALAESAIRVLAKAIDQLSLAVYAAMARHLSLAMQNQTKPPTRDRPTTAAADPTIRKWSNRPWCHASIPIPKTQMTTHARMKNPAPSGRRLVCSG